eukprot:gene14715-20755_t
MSEGVWQVDKRGSIESLHFEAASAMSLSSYSRWLPPPEVRNLRSCIQGRGGLCPPECLEACEDNGSARLLPFFYRRVKKPPSLRTATAAAVWADALQAANRLSLRPRPRHAQQGRPLLVWVKEGGSRHRLVQRRESHHSSEEEEEEEAVEKEEAVDADEDDFLFCPQASSLEPGHPDYATYLSIFQGRWKARRPVIVRGVRGKVRWDPNIMVRACRELGSKRFGTKDKVDTSLQIAGKALMLKVKDWPPEEHFKERLVRHNQDFIEMLPLKMYTHPSEGPLNLAAMMPRWSNPTDLGPKTYIAMGQVEEHPEEEYDSVTKLHQDMGDAVNILVHCQLDKDSGEELAVRQGLTPAVPGGSYGCAGAVWDIWRMSEADVLREYLQQHASEFVHRGERVDRDHVGDAIFDHCFMLSKDHLKRMKGSGASNPIPSHSYPSPHHSNPSPSPSHHPSMSEASGRWTRGSIEPWHFEQHQHEAVFIPGGCPHQVRNLRSCIKVAVDFVSPECLEACEDMAQRLAALLLQEGG